jgi:glycosyltransferase involved in cell wall biosynthesis
MPTVLLVAFHFPPILASSGLQRPLNYCRYLPEYGWNPVVLTVQPQAYEQFDESYRAPALDNIPVYRAPALDAARHLSIRGRYLRKLATPDRWSTWIWSGTWLGERVIRQHRPQAIWATYPILSALSIASRLSKRCGLPWIADLRDAVMDDDYPSPGPQREIHRREEARAVASASRIVLTTPASQELYRTRYPELPVGNWRCIANGYAEDDFAAAERELIAASSDPRCTLLHSGLINLEDRDPRPFLDALRLLASSGAIHEQECRVLFRAPGDEAWLRTLVAERGLSGLVEVGRPVPYVQALREMIDAGALLLFQGPTCNHLIPAKAYEYMRAGKPILALTPTEGQTGRLIRDEVAGTVIDSCDPAAIAGSLATFVAQVAANAAPSCDRARALKYSRRTQAESLANLLYEVASAGTIA